MTARQAFEELQQLIPARSLALAVMDEAENERRFQKGRRLFIQVQAAIEACVEVIQIRQQGGGMTHGFGGGAGAPTNLTPGHIRLLDQPARQARPAGWRADHPRLIPKASGSEQTASFTRPAPPTTAHVAGPWVRTPANTDWEKESSAAGDRQKGAQAMNDRHAKRFVAIQEGRCEIHAIRLDAQAAIARAFDEIEQRLLDQERKAACPEKQAA